MLVVREPGSAAKPGIWLDCGIHAREWVSPPACLHVVDTLVQDSNAVDPRDNLLRDCLNDVRKYNSFVTNVQNEDDKIIVIEQLRELAGNITGSLSHIHAQICFTCALHVAPKNI